MGVGNDLFHIHTSRSVERELLREYDLINEQQYFDLPPAPDHEYPELPGLRTMFENKEKRRADKLSKLYHALGGGIALVLPTVVMVLVPGKSCSLLTTSVCVIAFSFVVALGSKLKPQEILAVTAAYAAVLVVFVGTSLA